MHDQVVDVGGALLLATGAGAAAGVATLLEGGVVAELVIGFAGALLGGAVVWGATRERLRVLVEGQSALWAEINELRRANLQHLKDWHQ